MSNPFGDHARQYYEQGLSVIPLSPNSKKPFLSGWQRYCSSMPTVDEFSRWEGDYSGYNIGLCLGPASGVLAIDFDSGTKELARDLLSKIRPFPWAKRGKKGWTAFYQYNEAVHNKDNYFRTLGVDILSKGSQTVMPPSIHPDTKKPYEWISYEDLIASI